MKLAYNITLPVIHILALLGFLVMGYCRMLAWFCWFWVNDLVYILTFAVLISGHWLLLNWGKKKELVVPKVVQTLRTVDYILFSLQLALVLAWLVWDLAVPFLNENKQFAWQVAAALLPVAAADIAGMALLQKISADL